MKSSDISSCSSGWISHINFPISLLILFQALELSTSSLFSAQHSASLHAHLIKHRNCFCVFFSNHKKSINSVKSNIQAHSTVMFIHSKHWNNNMLCMSLKIEASIFFIYQRICASSVSHKCNCLVVAFILWWSMIIYERGKSQSSFWFFHDTTSTCSFNEATKEWFPS